MKHSTRKWAILILTLAAIMLLGACKKKVAPPPPPPPPPPAAPTASLSASPNTIEKGQSTTLTWQTTNATDVTLGPNKVEPNGSASVSPADSTTFHLVAKGPGGTQEATARVTVTQPPPPPPPPPQPSATDQELFNQSVKDVFFDYDSYDLRPDAQAAVQGNAQFLQAHPGITFTVEGHCDERGSTEYNLALGDNRANAVKTALVQAGVGADRIKTISYGKEKPFCTESNEQCWQQNRRGHFVYGK